ncbi:MAG: dockerin type I repeat-containing protein [Bacteroidaceae bacterium]|nr:dockerin type I repeat-containing protein [Bacteroidaceae bacterium]
MLGDVNKDGSITIADVTMLVNQVLGKETPTVAADVNGDGAVTIADVTKLVNIVLGKDNAETIVIGGGDPTDGFD